jgi:CBS domain-containing protein
MPTLKDIMTANPVTCTSDATIQDVARLMDERDIGDVIIMDGETISGIVTDRDIVVRGLAKGLDGTAQVVEVCTGDVVTLSPEDDVTKAAEVMAQQAIRRLPVVESGRPVGIVSLGDLAIDRDPDSALADISAAAPDQ